MPTSPAVLEKTIAHIQQEHNVKIIFLDSDKTTLVRRYSDSRRLHPLSTRIFSLEAAIDEESKHLEPLIQQANIIIDTGSLSTHELAERLREFLRAFRYRIENCSGVLVLNTAFRWMRIMFLMSVFYLIPIGIMH